MRTPAPGDLPPGAQWQDGRCDCRTRSEHETVCFQSLDRLIRDHGTIRNFWDDDEDRITRRIAGALQAPGLDAVVAVVLDETSRANDARKAVERAHDLARTWDTDNPQTLMSRKWAAEVLRQVLS